MRFKQARIRLLVTGGGTTAPVLPTTQNFTFAQVGPGWGFGYDDTTRPDRRTLSRYNVATAPTSNSMWVGYVTGTTCTVNMVASVSNTFVGMLEVSVDGGAFTAISGPATGTAATLTIFSGLADTTHLVVMRIGSSFGITKPGMPNSGNVMSVTGVAPAVQVFSGWRLPGGGEADSISGNALIAAATNYYPSKIVMHPTTNGVTANNPSIRVRGDYTSLCIAATSRYVYYSVDGGTPTRIDRNGSNFAPFGPTIITGLSGTHTYNVWTGDAATAWLSVGGIFASTGVQAVPTPKRLDQLGDSITYGAGADSPGDTDTFILAGQLGYVGTNLGHSGWRISDGAAAIDALLAGKTVTSNDVAVIALGYNDSNVAMSAQQQADYTYIVNAMLTKGYRMVLCRGVHITTNGGVYNNFNPSLAALVASIANPKVKYLDPSCVTAVVDTAEGLHPTATGYAQLAAYFLPAYQAAGV